MALCVNTIHFPKRLSLSHAACKVNGVYSHELYPYLTLYQKKDHYEYNYDNAQLAFYKCSSVYTYIIVYTYMYKQERITRIIYISTYIIITIKRHTTNKKVGHKSYTLV